MVAVSHWSMAMPLKQHAYLVRLAAAVLIATAPQACTSWRVRPLPLQPEHLSPSVRPGNVRLTLADGGRLTVLRPVIRGDSLFGEGLGRWIRQGNRPPRGLSPVALALTSIREVAVEETDGAKTFLLVVGTGVTLVAAIVLFADINNDCYSIVPC